MRVAGRALGTSSNNDQKSGSDALAGSRDTPTTVARVFVLRCNTLSPKSYRVAVRISWVVTPPTNNQ